MWLGHNPKPAARCPQVQPVHCAIKDRAGREHSWGAQTRAGGSDTDWRSAGVTLGLQSQLRRQTQAQTAIELYGPEFGALGLG